MIKIYIYVVDRDLGFAPNPFHGFCSLATCKPGIRSTAKVGDWIVGIGGKRLKATGKCVFAMKVTDKLTYNEYWENPLYNDKKPVRNGSKSMLLGDNIYYFNADRWHQSHSHHSNVDGSINTYNLKRDTKSSYVLLSKHFYYFGKDAPFVPLSIQNEIGYRNGVGHSIFNEKAKILLDWLDRDYKDLLNLVISDPFDFEKSDAHYSVETNKMTK
jgi:hypothetical protein